MAYQRAYFPSKVLDLSQGYGAKSSTHKLSYALDFYGVQDVIAPFNCRITKLYQPIDTKNHANTVWLTSTQKVLCANGHYGYLTMSITHPKDISKLKLGTIYHQGDKICTTKTMTGNCTGNHYHLELGKGTNAGWQKKTAGKYTEYVIKNKIKPEEYLFATEDTTIKRKTYKGTTYNFIKEKDITYKVVGVPSEPLLIRNKLGIKIGELYNGDEVLKFDNNAKCLVYHYSVLGYTFSKYLKK